MSILVRHRDAAAPPPPAAIAVYFRQRHGSIAELTPADLLHNERLWAGICGREPAAAGQDGGEAGSPAPSEGSPLSRTKMAVCEECGGEFRSQRSTARFCSQACQKRARRAA
jgi:hypothetical protein